MALRDRSSEIDELAATVADAAATTRASLARRSATLPSIDARARNSASVDVDAARSRMRARGVLLEAPGGRQRVSVVRPARRCSIGCSSRASAGIFNRRRSAPTIPRTQPTAQPLAEDLPDVCSICLEARKRGQQALTLRCGHAFHGQCILRWLEQSATCPICKEVVPSAGGEAGAAPRDGSVARGPVYASMWNGGTRSRHGTARLRMRFGFANEFFGAAEARRSRRSASIGSHPPTVWRLWMGRAAVPHRLVAVAVGSADEFVAGILS